MSEARDPLRFLPLDEAAAIVGFDPAYLKQQLEDGCLGGIKRGREWRVPYRALEVWVERIAQVGQPPPGAAEPPSSSLLRRGRGRPRLHQGAS